MNVQKTSYNYIDKMLNIIKGIKSLILDQETFDIISIGITKTELLEKEVVLIDHLNNLNNNKRDGSTNGLNCIVFIRPTNENIEILSNELENPHFKKYNIFFSNLLLENQLNLLARHDNSSSVDSVIEFYLDFYPLNSRLFSLNINNIVNIRNGLTFGPNYERIVFGLFSFICSQKVKPQIRFDISSKICESISHSVYNLIEQSPKFQYAKDVATVLILDRKSDPVLPLIHSWFYSSALHDSFGIDKNVININNQQYVLNERTDIESSKYFTTFISDLSKILTKRSENYKNLRDQIKSTPTDISDFNNKIASVGKGQVESIFINTHLDLITLLLDKASKEELPIVSQLEQLIVSTKDQKNHFNQINELINNPKVTSDSALRLVILYILRYEKLNINEDINLLINNLNLKYNFENNLLNILFKINDIIGENKRGPEDIFSNKTLFSQITNNLKNVFDSENSQYELYKPLIFNLIESFIDGKLSKENYPFFNEQITSKINKLIIFYVGGATYEEMRIAEKFSNSEIDIIIGGTTIHNSKSFLNNEIKPFC